MSKPIVGHWPGGEHAFMLSPASLLTLDERLRGGVFAAWARVRSDAPRPDDVYETLRLGLIDGGMPVGEAKVLMARTEDQEGLGPLMAMAALLLFRSLYRRPTDYDGPLWPVPDPPLKLAIGQIRALDDKCEDGVFSAWARLRSGLPRFVDVYETVRIALIGGGMDPEEAKALTDKVEGDEGMGPFIPLANLALFQAFYRREESEGEPEKPNAPEPKPD